MMNDTMGAMMTFAKVVEQQSFSEAGRRLGMSKSAVSKQVSRLEDRLGVRLLNRTTRRVSATEIGTALYERCRRIMAELEEAEQAILHHATAPRGRLRINAPAVFGHMHLAPLLPELLERYPDLSLDVSMSDRVVDLIEDGYDVAVRIAALSDSSLFARKLCDARRVLVASPDYLARHGLPADPAALGGHACLTYSLSPEPSTWSLRGPRGDRASVSVSGPVRIDNGDALMSLALGGAGIALMPTFFCGVAVADGRLTRVLPEYDDPFGGIYAVYPHNRHLSPKVRVFIDHLVAAFSPTPPWDLAGPSA